MNWWLWLGVAVLAAAMAALTGIKAKGTRPVARTRLMGVARFILILLAAILLFVAIRSRG